MLSFMPILLRSLHWIDFYSPSLRRLSVSFDGLRLPHMQTYIAENSSFSRYYELCFFKE